MPAAGEEKSFSSVVTGYRRTYLPDTKLITIGSVVFEHLRVKKKKKKKQSETVVSNRESATFNQGSLCAAISDTDAQQRLRHYCSSQ